ncbi:hypothetical protein IHE44_0012265 [Lamprotornis superbus]|uniref:Uncharacterized protein n=1 Tax=Lamprotornis superbus TaxID=245042 RepID=A0A835NUU0_9PASS|nr:hypothetical protein IHE44_0012265 [Lamprotornis superbus]
MHGRLVDALKNYEVIFYLAGSEVVLSALFLGVASYCCLNRGKKEPPPENNPSAGGGSDTEEAESDVQEAEEHSSDNHQPAHSTDNAVVVANEEANHVAEEQRGEGGGCPAGDGEVSARDGCNADQMRKPPYIKESKVRQKDKLQSLSAANEGVGARAESGAGKVHLDGKDIRVPEHGIAVIVVLGHRGDKTLELEHDVLHCSGDMTWGESVKIPFLNNHVLPHLGKACASLLTAAQDEAVLVVPSADPMKNESSVPGSLLCMRQERVLEFECCMFQTQH